MADRLRVLLVEDDEDDYLLTRDLLADIPGGGHHLDWGLGISDTGGVSYADTGNPKRWTSTPRSEPGSPLP